MLKLVHSKVLTAMLLLLLVVEPALAGSAKSLEDGAFFNFEIEDAAPCVLPDIPLIKGDPNICFGVSSGLRIAEGNLNDATQWQWYEGSCGGTPVGIGDFITVSPAETTVYYVRGEGACVGTSGTCASFTVNVHEIPNAIASSNSPVCVGDTIQLLETGGEGLSWEWEGPGGFTSSLQNPIIPNADFNAEGIYRVTLTDSNGCTDFDEIDIKVNALPVLQIDSNDPLCHVGYLELFESGGEAVSWSWTGPLGFTAIFPLAVVPNATVIHSGTYSVTITDANGCKQQGAIEATINPPPFVRATANSPFCFGESIQLDETGGEAVSWQWDGPDGFSSTAQNPVIPDALLSAQGTYYVTAMDANGCMATDEIFISIHPLPAVQLESNSPVCEGRTLELLEMGGDAASWSWTGPNGFSSVDQNPVISNATSLNSGTYYVMITDVNGCSREDSITVLVGGILNVSLDSNSPVCEGATLNLMAIGSGANTWSWTGPNGFSSTDQNPVITNAAPLNSGTYSVIVTETDGCTYQTSVDVTVNATPEANAFTSSPLCFGETVLLEETGGDAVSWQWDGPDGFSSTDQNPGIANAPFTAQGTYSVTVTDANACVASDEIFISIQAPPTVQLDSNSPVCEGSTLDFLETGGDANNWLWTGPNGFSAIDQNPVISDAASLNSGTYYVTITDINACTQEDSITVIVEGVLNVTLESNSPVCEGATLNLMAIGSGADSWSWTGPNGFSSTDQNPVIANAAPSNSGTYYVAITGENGCTYQTSIDVVVHATPDINAFTNSPICFGETVSLEETGGDAVSWQWLGPDGFNSTEQNPTIPGAPFTAQGTYSVTITDANGCTASAMVEVVINSLPLLEVDNNSPICEGDNLEFYETGGAATNWSWTGPNGFSSSDQNPVIFNATTLHAGTYYVTISDANGCTQLSSINATVNALPVAMLSSNSPVCEGNTLNLTETGGDAVSWLWTGPNDFSSTDQNPVIANVEESYSGMYSLTVTNANGCTQHSTIEVTVHPTPELVLSYNDPVCVGSTLILTETGGDAISWSWTGPNDFSSTEQNPEIVNVTAENAGVYFVVITDVNACTQQGFAEILLHEAEVNVVSNSPVCLGNVLTLMETGGDAVSWSWTGPNGFTSTEQNPLIENVVAANFGTYFVVVTDVTACTVQASIEVTGYPGSVPTAMPVSNSPICEGGTLSLTETGGDAFNWQWSGPDGFASTQQNPGISNVALSTQGTYSVTITDINGCMASNQMEVIINPLPLLDVNSNSPVCEGSLLEFSETGGEAINWSWTGPNDFNSSDQNPLIADAFPLYSGTYSITITDASGCIQQASIDATVQSAPVAVLSSNSPVCEGSALNLEETGGEAVSWSWTGPDGFSSTDQNPVITSAEPSDSGIYMLSITNGGGCIQVASIDVEVYSAPVVALSSNSPLCEGDSLNLMETGNDAVSWSWTGPNDFSSTDQNPIIANVLPLNSGTYSLVATNTNACTQQASINVMVNAAPTVSLSSNSPVCTGYTLNLMEMGGEAVSWSWTGPNGFSSADQNPVLADADTLNSGTYSVTVTGANACKRDISQDIIINELPLVIAETSGNACTNQSRLILMETGGQALSWAWEGPGGFSSSDQNPDLTDQTIEEGNYSVVGTDQNGCSDTSSVDVEVLLGTAFMSNFLTPNAGCVGDTLHFIEISETNLMPTSILWDFGDGNSSTDRDPIHVYSSGGNYMVEVEVFDQECGNISLEKPVEIVNCESVDLEGNSMLGVISPNPNTGSFNLDLQLIQNDGVVMRLFNSQGIPIQKITKENVVSFKQHFSVSDRGIYFLKVKAVNLGVVKAFKVVVVD